MKIFIATSIVVDIERKKEIAGLLERLMEENNSILMSSVVTSEIFTEMVQRRKKAPEFSRGDEFSLCNKKEYFQVAQPRLKTKNIHTTI